MLKQGFYTAVLTTLFAATPVLADHHGAGADTSKHPAHQMEDSVAPQGKDAGKQHGEYQWKDKKKDKSKDKDKRYRQNQEHPAHQMDEQDALRERGS